MALLCLLLEQLAEAPGDLVGRRRRVRLAEQRPKRHRRIAFRQRIELLDDLDHRPVGDPFAVRQAAAPHDPCLDACEELSRQPRLPHTRRAEHGEELAGAVQHRLCEGISEPIQLVLAADQRRREAPGELAVRRDQPERRNRLRPSPSASAAPPAPQQPRRGPTQASRRLSAFARRGGLFQAGGNVDRVAGGESLGGAGDDLAGGQADPTVHP